MKQASGVHQYVAYANGAFFRNDGGEKSFEKLTN
jgi:hypothetical protein